MRLSQNFHLSEFTRSTTAAKLGVEIVATEEQIDRLREATDELFQKLRDRFGKMSVTSGLRNEAVNEAVGGSSTSAHLTGDAADFYFHRARTGDVLGYLEEGHLKFDQVILYPKTGHIHLGYKHPVTREQRGQLLIFRNGKYALWTSR